MDLSDWVGITASALAALAAIAQTVNTILERRSRRAKQHKIGTKDVDLASDSSSLIDPHEEPRR